jgi:hypothetical protein
MGGNAAAVQAAQATKRIEDSREVALQNHVAQFSAGSDEKIFSKKFTGSRSDSLTEW